jgi:predicted transcriptional regulator
VRGELHQRLVAAVAAALRSGTVTQESLAKAVGMHQTTVSGIIRRNAGTLDLDEADAALRHIGSSMADFLANLPPRGLSDAERLAHALSVRMELRPWIEGLLRVPVKKLPAVLELITVGVRAATGTAIPGNTGSRPAPRTARRTTAARAQRPRAPKRS